ncbi:hypothetical protein KDU71_03900 [Carboxylicivirga sediminis]|uniref:Alpha-L-rhamnosidase six-hairpin glycosidase domain-containing protein n=1 Tax=Carboxylicivirga sediminis TaxID=2006564 RepID=A0A941IUC0_9BACT|nr:hypothetical protein [Carboxylicivirga sediminis]MBR8534691.1 hypothetical protein [Carboxylicivirga sediminis]
MKIQLIGLLALIIITGCRYRQSDSKQKITYATGDLSLQSDNAILQEGFNWAVDKTSQFVMTGKNGLVNKDERTPEGTGTADYIPSYWAGYYDRTAFYSRDFVHQAVGAQIVGLWDENYTMFNTFAANSTEARDWWTLWAFNFDGTPHHIDYRSENKFVKELPAQFELIEKAYKQYLWSGDKRYIRDSVLWNFYTRTLTDFIALHDPNNNGVAEGKGGIWAGSCTYNERGEYPIEAGDGIACQYQATLAYAHMLMARGEAGKAQLWYDKSAALKDYFNNDWSVTDDSTYARGLNKEGVKLTGFGKENSWFMPLKLITEPGQRNDNYLEFIADNLGNGIGTTPTAPHNIEAYTYLPDMYFHYNRNDEGWKWMKYILSVKDLPHERPSQGTNGDYPEISYTIVSQVVEGMMGIEPNAIAGQVNTVSRLPKDINTIKVNNVRFGDYCIDLEHVGVQKSVLTNKSAQSLNWEVCFYGTYNTILVNEIVMHAEQKTINGSKVSFVQVDAEAGLSITAEAQVH